MPGKDRVPVEPQEPIKEEIEQTERYEDRVANAILGVASESEEEELKPRD